MPRHWFDVIRPTAQRDVDDELAFHFAARIEDLIAQGIPRDAAQRQADAEFGDVRAVRANLTAGARRRAARRSRAESLRDVVADVRYVLRSLRTSPGFTITVLATLTLGVGANAAMFSFLDAVFVRPPAAIVAPAQVHRVWNLHRYADGPQYSTIMSYGQFEAIRAAIGDRAAVTVFRAPYSERVTLGQSVGEAQISYAPRSYFDLLGVRAARGRLFSPEEDDLANPVPVTVVSDAYWRTALDADPSVIGKAIRVSGHPYTVIGVMPPTFSGVDLNAADVWLPLTAYGTGYGPPTPWWKNPRINGLTVLARVRPGVSEPELEQRVTAALRHAEEDAYRDTTTIAKLGGIVAANGPGRKAQEEQIGVRLAGVAIVVLLIGCANVVNLLLSRAVRRRREIAIRVALGISKGRLLRLLLLETVVLSIGAALLALIAANVGGRLLRALMLPDVHWSSGVMNVQLVGFALGIAVVAGLLAGLVPALQATSPSLTGALKVDALGARVTHSSLRAILVAAQAALSVVLLIGAALFIRSLDSVRNIDIGFDQQRLLTVRPGFDDGQANDPTYAPRLSELARQLARVPGVERVALVNMEPMAGFSFTNFYTELDAPGSRRDWLATFNAVSPEFFATAGLRIVQGTGFPDVHGSSMPRDVVVNQEMARLLWPGQNPVGKCIRFVERDRPCYTVTGVVENGRMDEVIEDPKPLYYLPLDRMPEGAAREAGNVLVRVTPRRMTDVERVARALVIKTFPGSYPRLKTMRERLEPQYRPWRLGASLFTAFGALALVVAVVGIYSTAAYSVSQRVHEFGIRIALGATLGSVLRLVMSQSLRVVAIGLVAGVGLALAAGRLIASLLYGVRPNDPATIAAVVIVLALSAMLASLLPAWRATRVDPVSALRSD